MTPQDIQQLAREAGFEVHDRKHEVRVGIDALIGLDSTPKLRHFAALVLERAAQNHDEAATEWGQIAKNCTDGMYDWKQMAAEQLADDLRNMAKGLG